MNYSMRLDSKTTQRHFKKEKFESTPHECKHKNPQEIYRLMTTMNMSFKKDKKILIN